MCDYSLHAVATRPAEVGETLISTTVLQLPVAQTAGERAPKAVEASAANSIVTG